MSQIVDCWPTCTLIRTGIENQPPASTRTGPKTCFVQVLIFQVFRNLKVKFKILISMKTICTGVRHVVSLEKMILSVDFFE